MSTFQLRFDGLDKPIPNSEAEIDIYREGIKSILKRLQEKILFHSPDLLNLVNNLLDDSNDIFFGDHIDIQKHPRLWAKTNRIGSSDIWVENTSVELSTYEELNKRFIQYLKNTSRFNTMGRRERHDINIALDELQQWQADINTAYMMRLRNATAEALKDELYAIKVDDWEIQDFINRIEKIKNLTANDLETSTASLKCCKEINTLRNDLLKFNEVFENANLAHWAQQLSVVTKRWIDPFYEHPKELTKAEKARKIAKMIIINIAELLAVTAFILFFVFPPASFPVGVAASIGMLPILDGMFEIGRNIWYGRSPTKDQAKELGIAIFIVVGLTFCAYGIAAIGMSIMQGASALGAKMVQFGTFMATKFMRFIDVVLNTLGSGVDAFQFKKSMEPKTEKQLHNCKKPIELKVLMKILYDKEINLQQKQSVMAASGQLRKSQYGKEKLFYLYKVGNNYSFKNSNVKKISTWGKGFFNFPFVSSEAGRNINKAVKAYSLLPIIATKCDRQNKLCHIDHYIKEWKKSHNVAHIRWQHHVAKVEKMISDERATLNELKVEQLYLFRSRMS